MSIKNQTKYKQFSKIKIFFIVIIIAILFCGYKVYELYPQKRINSPTPTVIGYRELIEKTDKHSIYRDCKYRLESVIYDTIPNRTLSTIENPTIKINPISDKVDLNEIFNRNGEENIDWNFAELSKDEISYLNSIGVYWDGRYRCYRKHK